MTSVIIIAVAAIAVVYVSWRAGRLDRLHTRLETARASLDAALVRRSSVALELGTGGLLDLATGVLLAEAAHHARSAQEGRELAESELTRTLRTVLSQPDFRGFLDHIEGEDGRDGAHELLAELESTSRQVFLARKFYNDVVAATRLARSRPLARVLRLSGRAQAPEFFEMDDSLVAENTSTSLSR